MYTAPLMAENNEKVSPDYTNIYIPDTLLQAVNRSNPTRNQSSLGRKMLMVPPLLRQEKSSQHEYDPMVVSLGPYHHGKNELQLAEDFKVTALEMLVADSGKDMLFFYTKVLEVVNDARNCYIIDDSTSQYDDPNFAQMMLLDACFIINHVLMGRNARNYYVTTNCLGYFYFALIQRDLFLLENQIPFWLVKMLICLGYGKDFGEEMLNEYLNSILFGDYKQTGIASSDVEQPFHLLDAFWQILVSEDSIQTVSRQMITPAPYRPNKLLKLNKNCITLLKNILKFPCQCRKWTNKDDEEDYSARKLIHSFRSASELKSRGVHFRPSRGNSLKSIRFKPGNLTATLEVPIWFVSLYTKGFFLNMIAYELCPNTSTDRAVTAYIEFMKALIDNPKDVKELREKKILLTTLGNDEDVVKVYEELNTYGMGNTIIFHHVKEEIQAHYNNKGKTWLAELIYIYFRTPWTVIALLAATFLLVLTFLQTYFTLNPRNG